MRDKVSRKLESLSVKRDRKSTPKERAWELLDAHLLAYGHYVAHA